MPDARLDELRRRVQKDPASIAFAQLAEELRRAGQLNEAVDVCRAGLAIHPSYLSARVTLGRALIDLKRIDEAQKELEQVRRQAPENLAAIRALADIHRLGGRSFDPSPVESGVAVLEETNAATAPAAVVSAPVTAPPDEPVAAEPLAVTTESTALATESLSLVAEPPVQAPVSGLIEPLRTEVPPHDSRTRRTIAALERWLDVIHVARAHRSA
jgi:tetratricopeptide (TPR) repeat protein